MAAPVTTELATLGAGCFWGVEKSFRRKFAGAGLISAKVGYAGGVATTPSYRQVCTGQTGHAEVIQIEYDSRVLSYETILDFFFRMHDPTTLNRQGGDVGTQYRSCILFHSPSQEQTARSVIDRIQPYFGHHKISTTLEPFHTFWSAEEYHQEYLTKNPDGYECPSHFERTWERIKSQYSSL
ncbi:peptide methionine sulfoxide reductase MsrA [Polychytrium aggregatum]|uniref:peptide methionine sulfoxide reductase MsrA n=1 Tax=Polychytrium aggregatum TaxID=110093 RepID=UPI0022FE4E4F|nr:peptide methionine sulfoxide reductase MsrA [Polychytrium aggregatum]KAI9193121.1 peptide methionine sulfoxide reductase MsrA [Polychytrium aggregatum]